MDEQTDQYIMFMSATYIDDNFLPVILYTYILYPLLKESRKQGFTFIYNNFQSCISRPRWRVYPHQTLKTPIFNHQKKSWTLKNRK